MKNAQIELPWLVRIKPGALERLGLYLARPGLTLVALFYSEGLVQYIVDAALRSFRDYGIGTAVVDEVKQASAEEVAATAVYLTGPAAAAMTGQVLVLDGGLTVA